MHTKSNPALSVSERDLSCLNIVLFHVGIDIQGVDLQHRAVAGTDAHAGDIQRDMAQPDMTEHARTPAVYADKDLSLAEEAAHLVQNIAQQVAETVQVAALFHRKAVNVADRNHCDFGGRRVM